MQFKTYILKATGEFAQFEFLQSYGQTRLQAFINSVPELYPNTHQFEDYKKYIQHHITEPLEFSWEDYELLTLTLIL